MPSLLLVLASTRPKRAGEAVADWLVDRTKHHGAFDLDVVDLRELDLPFLDEPEHPRFGRYQHAHTRAWSERVDDADALAFVTPEYNHGYPAPLKNALDFLSREWAYKPAGIVSYGGVSGGTRAMLQLETVLAALKMTPVVPAVNIPFVATRLDDDGALVADEIMDGAADAMLDELVRVESSLRLLRRTPTR
jgi:NAD(P)H-dependent FMN reductase